MASGRSGPKRSSSFEQARSPGAVTDDEGPVRFSLEEMASLVEDLMRIADDLLAGGDEVNAFLLDTVVNRLLDRAFGDEQ